MSVSGHEGPSGDSSMTLVMSEGEWRDIELFLAIDHPRIWQSWVRWLY